LKDTDPPKIIFPCEYPIKVLGEDTNNFREEVLLIIRRHAPDLIEESIDYRASRNGKYLSVKVTIIAESLEQIQTMFKDLKSSGRVQLVL
jgi:putative lipoic acid-binding regulatory protein